MAGELLDFIIGTHSQNDVHSATALSVQRLYPRGYKFFWDLRGAGGAARTRNIICTRFLQEGKSPYLIFIDRDLIFEPEDIKLTLDDLKNGYRLIGGCYAVKDGTQLSSYGIEKNGAIPLDREIHEVLWLASGWMGFPKSLLEDMVEKLDLPLMHKGQWSEAYPFFAQRPFHDGKDWMWLTEDYDFCDKARQIGVKSYIDTRIWLRHVGDYSYTVEEVLSNAIRFRGRNGIKEERDRMQYAVMDLAEFTGETPEQAFEKVKTVVRDLAVKWEEFRKNGNKSEDFYRDNELYLYDDVSFNAHRNYWKYRIEPLIDIKDSRVVDIGCGMGTAAFVLSHSGNSVTGYDINNKTIEFAKFRANKYKIENVSFTSEYPLQAIAEADYIVAIDTLEHIEDLESFMIELGSHMKRGGKFYHASTFGNQDISPMHFNHTKYFLDIMKKAGFLYWNDMWFIKN